jgi:hypothetical protein
VLRDGSVIVVYLHSSCRAIAVSPGSTVPALSKYATILKYSGGEIEENIEIVYL